MGTQSSGLGFDFCAFLNYDTSSDVQLYEIGSCKCEPNYSYGPVVRSRGILHYINSGKGTLIMNDKQYDIHDSQFFYIPAGVKAFYKADDSEPWDYAWLHIGGRIVNETFHELNIDENNPVCDVNDFDSFINNIFDNHKREYFCIGKLYEIIDHLHNLLDLKEKTSSDNLKLKYVRNVIQYINLKYSDRISVEGIARSLNLNRSYLSRLFHEATGMTIQEYLSAQRFKAAKDLLKNTDRTINDISCAVGYVDVFTFSKAFKKQFGQTPSEFRSGQ